MSVGSRLFDSKRDYPKYKEEYELILRQVLSGKSNAKLPERTSRRVPIYMPLPPNLRLFRDPLDIAPIIDRPIIHNDLTRSL